MKTLVKEDNFYCMIAQLLVVFCSIFGSSGIAQAECIGGVGTDDIVISNKATDFYISGDVVDCATIGSITLGPHVTIPAGAIFNLIAPKVFIQTDVAALLDSQLRIYTDIKLLNDTGITGCSGFSTTDLVCPVDGYPGQDAEYGRDVTHNDNSDGHAGFSFTKLDTNGNPLPPSASNWSCVKDNVTGLVWEVKTDDGGLQDMDNTYTWYNPDSSNNGGYAGVPDGGSCTVGDCDTLGYVQAVNTQGLCGTNDWRMPRKNELRNIVSLDRSKPSIDTDYFPNTHSSGYWSASPMAYSLYLAWYISFSSGSPDGGSKVSTFTSSIRLVRSGQ